jgi:hypothetical protein
MGRLLHLILLALVATLLAPARPAGAQTAAWTSGPQQDVASYRLEARLDPAAKQVAGRGLISYRNDSPDTLPEIWLRLYLNAFRGPDTAWMRAAGGAHRQQDYDPAQPGWIRVDRLALAHGGPPLAVEPGDPDETIARVALPAALAPGASLQLEVEWTARLPRVFARTGFWDDFFMVGQWYPKLAVYDRGRWDNEPWHANAEFFADFGDYDLALNVPSAYQTGASGLRLEETDQGDGTKLVRYRAERVTDLAWTAWPRYRRIERQVEAAGARLLIELLLPPEQEPFAERHLAASRAALDAFGRWYGPYPWPRLTLVVPPAGAEGAGGMEYPSLVTSIRSPHLPLGLEDGLRLIEATTIHEVAHQWFPLQAQSNEAREPWLDEGFADYLTVRLLRQLYPPGASVLELPFGRLGYGQLTRGAFLSGPPREPLAQPAWALSPEAYGAVIYGKGSQALLSLEAALGEQRFTTALGAYAESWRWRHPMTDDLQAALEAASGERLDWFFGSVVHGPEVVEYRAADLNAERAVSERLGEAAFPVEVRLTHADGSSRLERWDGRGPVLILADDDRPIAALELDPERRLPLQLDRLDDQRRLEGQPDAALALANRWLGLVQALLTLFGQLG